MANCSLSSELASWMGFTPRVHRLPFSHKLRSGRCYSVGVGPRRAIGVLTPRLWSNFKVLSPLWLWRGAFFFIKTDPDSRSSARNSLDNPDLKPCQICCSLNSPCWHLLPMRRLHSSSMSCTRSALDPCLTGCKVLVLSKRYFACADWLVEIHLLRNHGPSPNGLRQANPHRKIALASYEHFAPSQTWV